MRHFFMNTQSLLIIVCLCSVSIVSTGIAQWELVDSDSIQTIVPCDDYCYLRIDPATSTLEVILPSYTITSAAQDAVDRAPSWLQMDLEDNFRRLSSTYQNTYADLINNTYDPYVDEVCFIVAHTAPQTLSGAINPDIITVNVSSLYANDLLLDYVQIVNHGSAVNGGDYYSTTEYRVLENGDTLDIELPREKYYWYIAHFKLHKELPGYINPNTGSPATPPDGVFWRDFLMNCADSGYPLLRDMLDTCAVLWKCEQNTTDNGAVGALTQWIQDVMTFQSTPHHDQPVRIYRMHIGTCSVHSYLTSAAARAALVPATVGVMYSDNHKINEFWERRWVAWEPVNTFIDNPLGYQGWGWDVAAEWNWRGDGYIREHTEIYTDVCSLWVNVEDINGNPVDGARIKIYCSPCVSWGATAGWTGEDGVKLFLLGDSRTFSAQVTSEAGNYPSSGFETVITNSVAGATYTWDVSLSGEVPILPVTSDTMPANPTNDYRVVLDYDIPWEILYGNNFDNGNRFSERIDLGKIDFFICDEANFSSYVFGDDFQAFEISLADTSGSVDFTLPTNELWYAVFSNEQSLVLSQVLEVQAQLYHSTAGIAIEPQTEFPNQFILYSNYPNPFNSSTTIRYGLPDPANVKVKIYDILGREVVTLLSEDKPAGYHQVIWDGKSAQGFEVASSLYFYRFEVNNFVEVKKLILLR